MYLMIQNPGVAPTEGYLTLGMSTTRDCGVNGAIGQFGSGAKHAINVLLRAKLKVYIYCGRARLDFYTEDRTIDDGLVKKTVKQVMCKMGGTSTRTHDCGWCLDFGAIDWNDTAMALREFVSNAIDRTVRQNGEFADSIKSGDLAVIPVTEDQRRAKDGFTRIYVEMSPEVQRYYGELPKRFLHFSDPALVNQSILPKADRNLGAGRTPMIYRCGVLVREISETPYPSLFDYNLKHTDLSIDECRNSSEYDTRAACARLVSKADPEVLAAVFTAMVKGEKTFETELDPHYLCPSWREPENQQKENWQTGWQQAAGDAVLCEANEKAVFIARKGHKVKPVTSNWIGTAARMGIKTADQVLSSNEQKGRDKIAPTPAAIEAVTIAWSWLEDLKLTRGKPFPEVGCYRDVMDAECEVLGFQEGNGVYLRDDVAGSVNKFTLKVALEELVHYVTGSCDGSRDLQQFLFDMVIEIAA